MPTQAPKLPTFHLPGELPQPTLANFGQLETQAVGADVQGYGLSDADFKARYPQLWQSQQTFLNNLQTQMGGAIPPQMQNLMTRSGATNALASTGGWSLGTGTSGMANVARNLGVGQMDYQNQVTNQMNLAAQTLRPRTFGLSGADAANTTLANLAATNTYNATKYAYDVQASQFETGLQAEQAVASANASNAQTANIVGGIGSAVSSIASIAGIA